MQVYQAVIGFVSLFVLLLKRKSFGPNVSSFSSNNLSISKAKSKYPVKSSILWNNFVSHGVTKERDNLILESRTCDVKTMCHIVFISHILHILREYVVMYYSIYNCVQICERENACSENSCSAVVIFPAFESN